MLVIMVYSCLSPYWGDGPLWPSALPDRDKCSEKWWTNLLYINNLMSFTETVSMPGLSIWWDVISQTLGEYHLGLHSGETRIKKIPVNPKKLMTSPVSTPLTYRAAVSLAVIKCKCIYGQFWCLCGWSFHRQLESNLCYTKPLISLCVCVCVFVK